MMMQATVISVLVLLIGSAVRADDNADADDLVHENNVVVLTEKNFEKFVDTHKFVFVEFYAPWCGHCKHLAPIWESTAKKVRELYPSLVWLAKVDATAEASLATKFSIGGYPTLKFFADGQPSEYEEGREEDDFLNFIKVRADPNYKPPPSAVVDLTGANFADFVDSHEISLVEFYAPWCGHCKKLAPIYEKAAAKLKPKIPLAKMDATAEDCKEVAKKYEVTGYPTLKIFRSGRAFDYNGPRDGDSQIASYMEEQAAPPSKLMSSKKDLQKSLDGRDTDVTVVGFFESTSDPLYTIYMDLANELREQNFGFMHVIGSSVKMDPPVKVPSVVSFIPSRFYTKHEPTRHEFTSPSGTIEQLRQFVQTYSIPLVGHYNSVTKDKRYKTRKPLCLFFYSVDFSHDHKEATQQWRRKIADIAIDFKDIAFAVANDEDSEKEMKEFGLDDTGEEMNLACFDAKGQKFPMLPAMEEWSSKAIRNFLKKMKDGSAKPYYKSQAIPAKGKEVDGHVHVVVANNFDSVVKPDADVMLFLYAPWCGHCKHYAPEYKKLADEMYSKYGNKLKFAKMDATMNDLRFGYEATGYPTMYFVPAGSADRPVRYNGNREKDDVIKFMKQHAKKAFQDEAKEDKKDEL